MLKMLIKNNNKKAEEGMFNVSKELNIVWVTV